MGTLPFIFLAVPRLNRRPGWLLLLGVAVAVLRLKGYSYWQFQFDPSSGAARHLLLQGEGFISLIENIGS